MKNVQAGRYRRPWGWSRLAIACLAGCCASSAAVAQAQPRDPASQYVEWPVAGEGLECASIAVSPELDANVRRHEVKGVTALFVQVTNDGKVAGTRQVVASGFARVNQALDALARDRLLNCRARAGVQSLYVEVLWDFAAGRGVAVQARTAEPQDYQWARYDPAKCRTPDYPQESKLRNEGGTVKLAVLVDDAGLVTDLTVAKSSGSTTLDFAAKSAVSGCPLWPARLKGEPVRGMVMVEYVWRL